jgi:hypothetical protein
MTVSIKRWEPENIIFWLTRGRRIANRNLLLSTLALHLNFNVWMMWSIVVSNLPAVGFAMTGQQQFLLVSIPPLVGAIMRLFYACIWSWVGGGTWLGISTLFLLIPALGVGWLVQDISAPSAAIAGGGLLRHWRCGVFVPLVQHQLFLSQIGQGFCHGAECGHGQSWRVGGADRGAAGHQPAAVRQPGRRCANLGPWCPGAPGMAAKCWLYLDSAHSADEHALPAVCARSAQAAADPARPVADDERTPHLVYLPALPQQLRHLHRLFRRFPLLAHALFRW